MTIHEIGGYSLIFDRLWVVDCLTSSGKYILYMFRTISNPDKWKMYVGLGYVAFVAQNKRWQIYIVTKWRFPRMVPISDR